MYLRRVSRRAKMASAYVSPLTIAGIHSRYEYALQSATSGKGGVWHLSLVP